MKEKTTPNYRMQRRIPLGRLLVGLFFLLSPSINLFDLLPDFIGCFLILSALFDCSEVLPYFSDLRDKLKKYAWVSLSKFPALLIMMAIYSGDSSQRSIITVFAVGYAILDLLFLLPISGYLWDAFFYFGERFDCPPAIAAVWKVAPESFPKLTSLFFLIRAASSCLPEFSLLPVSMGDSSAKTVAFWLRAYPRFAGIFAIIVLMLGILLFLLFANYFKRLSKDGRADAILTERYLEGAETIQAKHEAGSLRLFFVFMAVGVGLGCDFILDEVNILPDILSACVLLFGILFLVRRMEGLNPRPVLICGIGYGILSLASTVLGSFFNDNFDMADLTEKDPEAIRFYRMYVASSSGEAILSILFSIFLFVLIAKVLPSTVASLSGGRSRQTEDAVHALNGINIWLLVISIFTAGTSCANVILSGMTETVLIDPDLGMGTSITVSRLSWFWMIPFALALVRLAIAIHLTDKVNDELNLKLSEI